jgi:signal transduction histidine kinase
VRSEGRPHRVLGERDRLIQVVLNLLSNALRYCPQDIGRVELALAGDGERVRLTVSDNGPGVPESERERIFERFRQLPRDRAAKGLGAGLGLAISRRIVEQHGGGIWVEDAAGGGACFVVELPSEAAALEVRTLAGRDSA